MKRIIQLIVLTTLVYSNVINIPDDQPTIQMGIVFAGNGDTVLVAPALPYDLDRDG